MSLTFLLQPRFSFSLDHLVTIFTVIASSVLFIIEFVMWIRGTVTNEMIVDASLDTELKISFDITFPHLECRCLFYIVCFL